MIRLRHRKHQVQFYNSLRLETRRLFPRGGARSAAWIWQVEIAKFAFYLFRLVLFLKESDLTEIKYMHMFLMNQGTFLSPHFFIITVPKFLIMSEVAAAAIRRLHLRPITFRMSGMLISARSRRLRAYTIRYSLL